MATYAERYTHVQNQEHRGRVWLATTKIAGFIINEDPSPEANPNHVNRALLAARVLGPAGRGGGMTDTFMVALSARGVFDSGKTDDAADAALDNEIGAIWDQLANAEAA